MAYRALLIGNSVFDADAGLNPLNAPVKDVARLHRALVDSDTGLFSDENVRLVTERTCDGILDELDQFFSAGKRDDLLLLYYSGHGVLDERNQLYLCGRDTRSDRLLRTGVSNVRINEFVQNSLAQKTVLVLDCCSSGMFKGGTIDDKLAGPGRYIISSTRGRDLANDAATATGTSLFTEHLVEGLLGAAPDTNGDGYIDLREIYDYVRDKLVSTTRQIPHCRFDGDAAISMARARATPPIARAAGEGAPHRTEPTFALAENTITLRDIEEGEPLADERIEVISLGDHLADLTARVDGDWLTARIEGTEVVVSMRPRLGRNSGKVTVRDASSGSTQVLRVEARVSPAAARTFSQPPASAAWPPQPQPPAPVARPPQPQPPVDVAGASVCWPGIATTSLGAILVVSSFSGAKWYAASGESLTVSGLRSHATSVGAHFALTYFGGLDWLLLVAGVICAILSNIELGRPTRWLRPAAGVLGVAGGVLALIAVQDIVTRARAQGIDVTGVFSNTASGFWIMLLGFALITVGATLPALLGMARRLSS